MATVKNAQNRGRAAFAAGASIGFILLVGGRYVVVGKDEPGAIKVPAPRVVTVDVPIEDCDHVCPSEPQCTPFRNLTKKQVLCCMLGSDNVRVNQRGALHKKRKVVGLITGWRMEPYMDGAEAKCRLHVEQSGKQRAAWQLLPAGKKNAIRAVLGDDNADGGG